MEFSIRQHQKVYQKGQMHFQMKSERMIMWLQRDLTVVDLRSKHFVLEVYVLETRKMAKYLRESYCDLRSVAGILMLHSVV